MATKRKGISVVSNLLSGNINEMNENKNESTINDETSLMKHYELNFDLDEETLSYLKNQTVKLHSVTSKAYTNIGSIFSETQEKLSNNKNGVFEKWFTQLGFAKRTVYNLINRSNYIVQNLHNKNLIESLPITLSYEITNPNCNEILREKVLNGDINSLKEFNIEKNNLISTNQNENIIENFEELNILLKTDLDNFKNISQNFNNTVFEKINNLSEKKKIKISKELEKINSKIELLLKSI